MREEIEKTVEVLKKGGMILYPTDTVWGIGCDATNDQAVERLYKLKQSTNRAGMIVLMESEDRVVRHFANTPSVAWELFELTDSPLTLILPNGTGVAQRLIAEDGSLAVRIPKHPFCTALLRRFARPLVSTSANISGDPTPKGLDQVAKEIFVGVDLVVSEQYERGATKKASSIISITESGVIKIIR